MTKEQHLIIICVETTQSAKTDDRYIRELISYRFEIRLMNNVILKFVYCNGKGNLISSKKTKEIESIIKKTRLSNPRLQDRNTHVIVAHDIDNVNSSIDCAMNESIQKHCSKYNYHRLYFNPDIERVLLGYKVEDNKKKSEAQQFVKQNKVSKVDFGLLKSERNISNFVDVFERIFARINNTK